MHETVDVSVVDTSRFSEQSWQSRPSGGDVLGAIELSDESNDGIRRPCDGEKHHTSQSNFGNGQLFVLLPTPMQQFKQQIFALQDNLRGAAAI